MADLVVAGGHVVTMDVARRVLDDGAVAIENGAIVAVGPTAEVRRAHPAARTIEAHQKVVMPGLVDLHAHSGGGLLKTVGEHAGSTGGRDMLSRVFKQFTNPEWWHVDGQLHALERLKFGTTNIFTMNGGNGTRNDDPAFIQASIDAFQKVGIRATIGLGPPRPPWPQAFSTWQNGRRTERMVEFDEVIGVCEAFLRRKDEWAGGLISFCTALSRIGNRNPHDPVWTEEHGRWVRPQAEAMRDLMRRYDVGFWTHIYGEAVEYVVDEGLGLFGPKTILSHATGITERGIGIIAETGCHVAHSPRARRVYSFGGRCPVVELVEAGVNVALGSDGPIPDRSSDIFLDMKVATTLQRLHFQTSRVIPPGLALEMATINGYRALGQEQLGGSLEVGKRADLILVDFAKPHLTPLVMPPQQLVYHATGGDVDTVIVDGKILIENKRALCLDEPALLAHAQELAEKTIADAGLESATGRPEGFWGKARY